MARQALHLAQGRRQDALTCYVHPCLRDGKQPNLHVLVETQVARILVDDQKRVVGVEVIYISRATMMLRGNLPVCGL